MPSFFYTKFNVIRMVWKPHVTVAAVIEQNSHFLVVEEHTADGLAFNQPAGHLEENEDFITAIKREVLEETAWQFEPQHVISVQLWRKNLATPTFLRVCFSGQVYSHNPLQVLDSGIVTTHWLSYQQLVATKSKLRSPLVLSCIEDYLNGNRYPLSLVKSLLNQ